MIWAWIRVQYIVNGKCKLSSFFLWQRTFWSFYDSSALSPSWGEWETKKWKSNKLTLPLASGAVQHLVLQGCATLMHRWYSAKGVSLAWLQHIVSNLKRWLSWLERQCWSPKCFGSISRQGTCLGFRFDPQLTRIAVAADRCFSHINVPLSPIPFLSL